MSAIKRFFEKKKLDVKFKQAGSGHKLTEQRQVPSSSHGSSKTEVRQPQSSGASRAGAAALARIQAQQNQPVKKPASTTATWKHKSESGATAIDYDQMKKEMNAQFVSTNNAPVQQTSPQHAPKNNSESENLAVEDVTFCCSLCPASLPKHEIYEHLHSCLLKELDVEPLMISITMIHTLNRDRSMVENCIHVLGKYLQNIVDHQSEEKYRKIRKSNKVFAQKVSPLVGVSEFLLKGCGFRMEILPFEMNGETTDHEFYVLDASVAENEEQLNVVKQMLMDAEPLEVTLDRNLKVFEPSSSANRMEVPQSFYSLSSSEVKREQASRTDDIEKSKQLRTKAMRDIDASTKRCTYKFTVLRIRFPDGVILQGTFKSSESISDVKDFVRESLTHDWLPFTINDSLGRLFSSDTATLASLKLAPAALVTFCIDDTVRLEIASSSAGGKMQFLKDECLILMQTLSS